MNTQALRRGKLAPLFLALFFATTLFAQMGGTSVPPSLGRDQDKSKEPTAKLTDREVKAFKAFDAIPISDVDKKVKAAQDFIKKFPNSPFLPDVYANLSVTYIQSNQQDKGLAAGEQALALNPNDTRTMANLAQALARQSKPTDADTQKAEQYAQKAIQLIPALPKPEGVTQQDFAAADSQTLAEAHSALGTLKIRRGQYAQAISDLQEAVRLDTTKDVTNFYLLAVANDYSSHFAEAVDAYTKCAAFPGNLQKPCQDGAAEAQKHVPPKSPKP